MHVRFMRVNSFCENTAFFLIANAPVICIPGSLGAGDSGDIAGPKCRDLTSMSPGSAVDVPGF